MNKHLRLGLYDEIDSGFKRWRIYNIALKKILLESDVEIYTRANFGSAGNCTARVTADMIQIIEQEFASISEIGSDMMKIIYTKFIASIAKPQKKANKKPQGEYDDEGDQAYTLMDEYNAVIAIQDENDAANEDSDVYEKQVERLDELTIKGTLSAVEEAALTFIKDKKITKNQLLNIFTMSGIIQIANRAAYKLFNA